MARTRSTTSEIARAAGRAAAAATRATGEFADRHRGAVAKSGELLVKGTGAATQYSGHVVESVGDALGDWAGSHARSADTLVGKTALRSVQGVGKAVSGGGWLAKRLGRLIRGAGTVAGEIVASGTASALKGGADVVDSASISQADLEAMRQALRAWGAHMQSESGRTRELVDEAVRRGKREHLMETLTVGGVTLAEIVRTPGSVDPQVLQAYEMAYPDLAATLSLSQSVARMEPIKGALGEQIGIRDLLTSSPRMRFDAIAVSED